MGTYRVQITTRKAVSSSSPLHVYNINKLLIFLLGLALKYSAVLFLFRDRFLSFSIFLMKRKSRPRRPMSQFTRVCHHVFFCSESPVSKRPYVCVCTEDGLSYVVILSIQRYVPRHYKRHYTSNNTTGRRKKAVRA